MIVFLAAFSLYLILGLFYLLALIVKLISKLK